MPIRIGNISLLLLAIVHINLQHSVRALNNGLAQTPPMGWISWARFTDTIDCDTYPDNCLNERLFQQMAERLATDGFRELGYTYVNLDDCWSERARNANEQLVADERRFPSGLTKLAEFVHKRSLKLGIYGDCGTATCQGYPAQLKPNSSNLEDNYFDEDAQLFASWQLDSLKFDGCNLDPDKQEAICPRMANALAATSRPMLLTCEYPFYMLRQNLQPNWSLVTQSCNTWRYYEDVEDAWLSVLSIIDYSVAMQTTIVQHHGPGHWFDPDQLMVGNFGLSFDEARAQMAIWCVWSAPLFMGNDLRALEPEFGLVLKNKKLIEVNQDKLGLFGLMVAQQNGKQQQAFVKAVEPVVDKCPSFVVVYLNRETLGNRRLVSFKLRDLLTKMPFSLIARRHSELHASDRAADLIQDEYCRRLLSSAMSRKPAQTPPPGLLVESVTSAAEVEQKPKSVPRPIEEREVVFGVEDLFGDPGAPTSVALDGELSARVNPSGVRAFKLTMQTTSDAA